MNITKKYNDVAKISIRDITKIVTCILVVICLFMEVLSFFVSPVLVTVLCWCISNIGIIMCLLYVKEIHYRYLFDWLLNEHGFPELVDTNNSKLFAVIGYALMCNYVLAVTGYYVGVPVLPFFLIIFLLFSSKRTGAFCILFFLLSIVLVLCGIYSSFQEITDLLQRLHYLDYVNAWHLESFRSFQNPFNQTLFNFWSVCVTWYEQCPEWISSLFLVVGYVIATAILMLEVICVHILLPNDLSPSSLWFERRSFKWQLKNKSSFEEADNFLRLHTDWNSFQWKVVCLQKLFGRRIVEPDEEKAESVYRQLLNSVCRFQ